jgi:glycosyltransferase involved in cell wall biosynthesis
MLNLAQGFADKGFAVDLILAKAEGPYLGSVSPDIRVVDLRSKRILWSIPRLIHYLRKARPTALLSTMDHTNVAAFVARAISRVPTTTLGTVHNTLSRTVAAARTWREQFKPVWIRMFYPLGSHVIAVSDGVAQDYLRIAGLDPTRVSVILNPVITPGLFLKASEPLDHHWFSSPEHHVILGVGRLTRQKNFLGLVRAVHLLRVRHRIKLVILGEGEERARIESLVNDLGLSEDVDLPGFVQNPYKYLKSADLFVLSSDWEGLPTVLIEAIALGTPVVATDCPSGPSEILGGESASLAPVGNVEALASVIEQNLVRGEPEKVNLKRFELGSVVDQYLRVLGLSDGSAG